MLSLCSATYLPDKTLVSTFSASLEVLPGASGDPRTMEWWETQRGAWEACRRNPRPPEEAMLEYVAWLMGLPGKPVFVAYPAGFDFTFVHLYLIRFTGHSPFSHSALDIKTYAMARLKTAYRASTKRNMSKRWFDRLPHTQGPRRRRRAGRALL